MATTLHRKLDTEGYIGITNTTVFTAPAAHDCKVWTNVSNIDSTTAYWFKAYKVASGGSAGNSNLIIPETYVPPNGSNPCYQLQGQTFEPGDTLVFIAQTASKLNVMGGVIKTLRSS